MIDFLNGYPIWEFTDRYGNSGRCNTFVAITYNYSNGILSYEIRPIYYANNAMYVYKAVSIKGTFECSKTRADEYIDNMLNRAYIYRHLRNGEIYVNGIRITTYDYGYKYFDINGECKAFDIEIDECDELESMIKGVD